MTITLTTAQLNDIRVALTHNDEATLECVLAFVPKNLPADELEGHRELHGGELGDHAADTFAGGELVVQGAASGYWSSPLPDSLFNGDDLTDFGDVEAVAEDIVQSVVEQLSSELPLTAEAPGASGWAYDESALSDGTAWLHVSPTKVHRSNPAAEDES